MRISIIGSGIVGQATGKALAKHGQDVLFCDTNPSTVAKLEAEGFRTASGLDDAVAGASLIILCLPTPPNDEGLDYFALTETAQAISPRLGKRKAVVVRSTVIPGTMKSLSQHIPAYQLLYNPEFLRQATAEADFLNQDRRVIGYGPEGGSDILRLLYEDLNRFTNRKTPIIEASWEEAELAKLVSNSFLATKISFFNEVWSLCGSLGIDSDKVSQMAAADSRIGPYGIKGGRPFGGRCLPKDLGALIGLFARNGLDSRLLTEALQTNSEMAIQLVHSLRVPLRE